VCVSLGLKKPGDFTVFEGHGYPRARPFSGSQHGRSVAWRRSVALLQAREEEEEDREEKRRKEKSVA